MTPSLLSLRARLSSFAESSALFLQIQSTAQSASSARKIFVLDSSFNPPTRAHFGIALSCLKDASAGPVEDRRLLLLLATQNADKAPKPASFQERLAMMSVLADDISSAIAPAKPVIDIAVTKHARFLDKASELAKQYPDVTEQVYLTGYDTLVRILDTRYYPPGHTLAPLEGFFSRGRIRCSFRVGDCWGSRGEQERYLESIRNGSREGEGCRRGWAERIEFVESDLGVSVSSTKAREAMIEKDGGALDELLTGGVKRWILERGLYTS